MSRVASLALIAACAGPPDHALEPPPSHALGMNDVTMLVPLPADPSVAVVEKLDFDRDTMVERTRFISFVIAGDMAPKTGEQLVMGDYHVVGVRFDLCDRGTEPCKDGEDGRLRLVLQGLYTRDGATGAFDIGVHLFFRIPAEELPDVVAELRRLAELQDAPLDAPLGVNPALAAGDEEYATRLRTLIDRYAYRDNIMRFTTLGQIRESGAFAWVARGMERHYDELVDFPIPEMGLVNFKQRIQLGGGDTVFDIQPMAPTAAAPALNGLTWPATTPEQKLAALDALAEIDNPRLRANSNTQCMGCHIASFLGDHRARESGIDASALPSRFASARDTTISGLVLQDARVVRGLGWAATAPIVSQRVANETALVADEMEQRFPAP